MTELDRYAIEYAERVQRRNEAIRCSFITGMCSEQIFENIANYTAMPGNTTAERSLMAGSGSRLPVVPANFFTKEGKSLEFYFSGILATNGAPTYTWTLRFHTSAVTATTSVSGTVVGITTALTTQSGVSDRQWDLHFYMSCVAPAVGASASLMCNGYLVSHTGLASPFGGPMQPTAPPVATWTVTLDSSLTYYPNLTITDGTGHASDLVTLKRILMRGPN